MKTYKVWNSTGVQCPDVTAKGPKTALRKARKEHGELAHIQLVKPVAMTQDEMDDAREAAQINSDVWLEWELKHGIGTV
jgi:hypothetical protein